MTPGARRPPGLATALAAVLLLAARTGSAGEERGRLTCDYCHMLVTDPRFGGQIVGRDGHRWVFDSTECLAAFYLHPPAPLARLDAIQSVRWDRPGALVDARTAWYLESARLPSPMELDLSAFATLAAARAARRTHPGELLRWESMLQRVRDRWFANGEPWRVR